MKYYIAFSFFLLFSVPLFSQQTAPLSLKAQKIQAELENESLPELPETEKVAENSEIKQEIPDSLNIDSQEVVKKSRTVPNEGKPFFTLSGGLAPYQANLGILKYFIPEWWGQIEIGMTIFPNVPVNNYYTAVQFFKPYIALKIITGYSFFTKKQFEMSLFVQAQAAFIGTTEIPIIPAAGFRFTISFFWLDVAVGYAVTVGGTSSPIFSGVQPVIALGFRF